MIDSSYLGQALETQPNESLWRMLERESLDFRFVQEPVFNLTEPEEKLLERLRTLGLHFSVIPRSDPTNFLVLSVTLEQRVQRVELAVEGVKGHPRSCSFVTRRSPFSDRLKEWLDRAFGPESFDHSRHVASRAFVWLSYHMPFEVRPASSDPSWPSWEFRGGLDSAPRSSLFNFDAKERHFLSLLEEAVIRLNCRSEQPLKFHVYPRETASGGIELMASVGDRGQPVRVFVKGFYPATYHLLTENTPLGERLREYMDEALGQKNLEPRSSSLKGRYISLIYAVRHPSEVLERFEG